METFKEHKGYIMPYQSTGSPFPFLHVHVLWSSLTLNITQNIHKAIMSCISMLLSNDAICTYERTSVTGENMFSKRRSNYIVLAAHLKGLIIDWISHLIYIYIYVVNYYACLSGIFFPFKVIWWLLLFICQ